ncbi:hypothetical protein PWT90_08808 [Aphanocladium album]|nr:hypothetical protein PWT90_08808 [Aphanocladium album]
MAPVNKEALEKSAVVSDHTAWDDAYTEIRKKKGNATQILAMDPATQEQLVRSGSSSRQKRGRPDPADLLDQLNEVGMETVYADQAFNRTMDKQQEVYNVLKTADTKKDAETRKGI